MRTPKGPRIKELLIIGCPYNSIVAKVGCSKATISYHARKLGLNKGRRLTYDWTEIRKLYNTGLSANECRRRFGFAKQSWREAMVRGDIVPRQKVIPPIETLLIQGKVRRRVLKKRLIQEGFLNQRCSLCKIENWQKKPIVLRLDHIDGNSNNNFLTNLRLICPNCDSQLPTYCAKNIPFHRKMRLGKVNEF